MRVQLFAFALSALMCGAALAAPIRVGIFSGAGPGIAETWHTNTHTAANAIASILAAPDSSNLGPDRISPPTEILVTRHGLVNGQGIPTAEQITELRHALDSLDVLVLNNNAKVGGIFTPGTPERAALETFMLTKGVVMLHAAADGKGGSWPKMDSLSMARFANFPFPNRRATLHLDTVGGIDAHRRFLNRGLPDTVRFIEEWHSYEDSGHVIRAAPGLRVTVRLDEASYEGGMGGAKSMGADHPISWYREFPEGGRLFFSGIGHQAQTYLGTQTYQAIAMATPPEGLYFLRRQIYNAVLWAAKADSGGVVGVKGAPRATPAAAWRLRRSGEGLWLEFEDARPRRVEWRSPDGRILRHLETRGRTVLLERPADGLLILRVASADGVAARKVLLP